eukprot:scaffold21553_cov248-Isochrysis_galbana.AAC.1
MAREVSAAKTPSGVAAPPYTITALTYFWVSMEHLPADARAAPSASAPNDTVMDNLESPKRPREASQGNMVSQRATPTASVLPESQSVTTELLPRAPARACQSLAHHTTPSRCRKSVDTWAPLSEESQSRSTTTNPAERLGKHGNSAIKPPSVGDGLLRRTSPTRSSPSASANSTQKNVPSMSQLSCTYVTPTVSSLARSASSCVYAIERTTFTSLARGGGWRSVALAAAAAGGGCDGNGGMHLEGAACAAAAAAAADAPCGGARGENWRRVVHSSCHSRNPVPARESKTDSTPIAHSDLRHP